MESVRCKRKKSEFMNFKGKSMDLEMIIMGDIIQAQKDKDDFSSFCGS